MFRKYPFLLTASLLSAFLSTTHAREPVYDLVVYGDSAAAVSAGIQAKREGLNVILVNTTGFLGGMTTAGLSSSDVNRSEAIGGVAKELFLAIGRHYGEGFKPKFEPHVAQAQVNQMVADSKLEVVLNEQLDRKSGVEKNGQQIVSIRTLSGRKYRARMFIDASYTGDLLAAAGVRYRVGRESNAEYGETINGVQRGDTNPRVHYTQGDKDHFIKKVDPYVKPGDPSSGLLPTIQNLKLVNGEGDQKIQAYNYRLCLTTEPANRIPIEKPAGYNELDHELLLRNFEAGDSRFPALIEHLPNAKVDWNTMHAVGSDYVGANWDYPEADYATRQKIEAAHELYIRGHLWTLANHPRVPQAIRERASRFGLCKDEFEATGHWPPMIYIREARRMVGPYVMTEAECKGTKVAPDPVTLASFGMDSHAVQYFVTEEGFAERDGVIWQVPPRPYGISYRSIIPRGEECENLLVPVCLSATHAAHGSIRMEPVFVSLGQAAATAAAIAVRKNLAVQNVPYDQLRAKLEKDGVPVEWKQPKPAPSAKPTTDAGSAATPSTRDSKPMRLPSGPEGPGRFGAYYTRLNYLPEWEAPWRVSSEPDVVVRFPGGGHKFVFWRGTSFIPCWVTDTGIWYTNEFVERAGRHSPNTQGCVEPMSDKQCRFSHVRVIESHEARVVIHWRYAPVDVHYNHPFIDPKTGWSDWVDEYYTIYPDAVGVRKITAFSTMPDQWMEWHEAIVINQPGTRPEDNIELGALSVADLEGNETTYEWTADGAPAFEKTSPGANIVRVNLKAGLKPFAIVPPSTGKTPVITPYRGHGHGSFFNFWDHWPVSQDASDGRGATSTDKPSHTSLCHIGHSGTRAWAFYTQTEVSRTKIMLHGMTDKPTRELVPLAKSWSYPAELEAAGTDFENLGYDPTERAYQLIRKGTGPLAFRLRADREHPLVNPALVIRNWGEQGAVLELEGRKLQRGKDYGVGYRHRLEGTDLVIWLKAESDQPVSGSISPL